MAAAPAPTPEQVKPRLQDEYVGAYGASLYNTTVQAAAWDFGHTHLSAEEIECMMHDPVIASDYQLLVESVLADGAQVIAAVTDEEAEGYEQAQAISTFCAEAIMGLESDLTEALEQMMEGLQYGSRIAEVTYKPMLNGSNSKLTLQYIKVKSRGALQFVLDRFMNLVGFTTGYTTDGALNDSERILPRAKFFVFTWRKKDEDPRGRQHFRALHTAWRNKIEGWPILQRYMKLFAVPGLIGKTSPNSKPEVQLDANGAPVLGTDGKVKQMTPQQAMLEALLKWENSTVCVVPNGAEVEAVQATGEGQLFWNFFRLVNQELTRGMLRQTRATTESQFGSKADSQTGQDLLATLIMYCKRRLAAAFRRDVLRVLVWVNFGQEAAERFAPYFLLGDEDGYDWAENAEAMAKLAPHVTDSQWDSLTNSSGIPAPLPDEERPGRAKAAPGAEEPTEDKQTKPGTPKPAPAKKNATAPAQRSAHAIEVMRRRVDVRAPL